MKGFSVQSLSLRSKVNDNINNQKLPHKYKFKNICLHHQGMTFTITPRGSSQMVHISPIVSVQSCAVLTIISIKTFQSNTASNQINKYTL